MQRTPGAVRVALFSFFVMMAAQPVVAPEASAREGLSGTTPIVAMNPQTLPKFNECLTIKEEEIGGKKFHIGTLAVNAPKEQVWNLLTDYESAPGNFSYLKKCSRVSPKVKGEPELVSFTAKTGVGPITVDYVLEIKETPNAGLIEWHRHSGAFRENEGYWKLESVDEGRKTLITYAKHLDAGFPLPPCMVNKAVKESMPVIFRDLNSSLERIAAGLKSNRAASKASTF